jgi:hypothetical protein
MQGGATARAAGYQPRKTELPGADDLVRLGRQQRDHRHGEVGTHPAGCDLTAARTEEDDPATWEAHVLLRRRSGIGGPGDQPPAGARPRTHARPGEEQASVDGVGRLRARHRDLDYDGHRHRAATTASTPATETSGQATTAATSAMATSSARASEVELGHRYVLHGDQRRAHRGRAPRARRPAPPRPASTRGRAVRPPARRPPPPARPQLGEPGDRCQRGPGERSWADSTGRPAVAVLARSSSTASPRTLAMGSQPPR